MKVINIPEKVRIGYADYTVEIFEKYVNPSNELCFGSIDWAKHTISLSDELGDIQQMEKTFLHEVLHGIIYDKEIDIELEDEEKLVDALARGLRQLIRDNPDIFMTNQGTEQTINVNINNSKFDEIEREISKRMELKGVKL